jgi:glucokinase
LKGRGFSRAERKHKGNLGFSPCTPPHILIIFSSMPDFSIGVDLGGTNLRIAAITSDGQLLEKVTLNTKVALGPDRTIDEMCDAIQSVSTKHKASESLLGVGIGVLGLIDMQAGTVRKSANFPGWENYPVRAEIERRLRACALLENDASVVIDNDSNVAALGEQWLGAARGVDNVAVLTLGTGIGGGIVLGGKIWHGMNGMAGEFGHVTVEPEGVPCGCGSHGCAERYASASAIMRMAREAIVSGEAPLLAKAVSSDAEFGALTIYNLAMQGDEPSRRIFQTFGRYLGMMLAGAVNVLNLEMYVLAGGVSSAWDAFAPTMFEELHQRSLVYTTTAPASPTMNMRGQPPSAVPERSSALSAGASTERKTIITRALLGSDAGLFGAARAAVFTA